MDRNILSYGRPEGVLPSRGEVVLPDAYFHEMAESKRDEDLRGFVSWIREHAGTVWIARYWWDLIEDEKRSFSLATPTQIISEEWTECLREHAKDGEVAWPEDERHEFYEKCKAEFIDRSRKWTERVADDGIDLSAERLSEDRLREWLRASDPIQLQVKKWESDLMGKSWSNCVGVFPDRPAVCRWWRIINYYTIMHSLGETAIFENNWEDAQYAFTASCVGRLATDDKRLIEMMDRIFPGVTIFTSD
ncbi:MAG: hypothetical protein V3T53_10390 [Phycisphaerales bacterium]